MQNRINVKEIYSKAIDINFRNLFQPVIPHLDTTGKIAQVISALTEAVTVWFICQSELSGLNKFVSVFLSIAAVLLVVSAIELGGRKGIQVLTRAIVWKRLKSFWYWALFIPVLIITGFLFFQSFQLSTKGTNQTFKQSIQFAAVFDDTPLYGRHLDNTDRINTKYDKQAETIKAAYTANHTATATTYQSRINAIDSKLAEHRRNKANGVKWAQSHIDKQAGTRNKILTDKAAGLATLTVDHNNDIKGIESARTNELTIEDEIVTTKQ